MTREEIASLIERFIDAFDRRDAVACAACHTIDCVVESPTYGRLIGRAAIEQTYLAFFASFPDATADYVGGEFVVTGNQVVVAARIHGTDTGGLLGQAATSNPFSFLVVRLCDLKDGLIVHEHRVYDMHGLLLQLAKGPDFAGRRPTCVPRRFVYGASGTLSRDSREDPTSLAPDGVPRHRSRSYKYGSGVLNGIWTVSAFRSRGCSGRRSRRIGSC
jgi:hypothetical protein